MSHHGQTLDRLIAIVRPQRGIFVGSDEIYGRRLNILAFFFQYRSCCI